ncbi:Osmotin, thaumatin-like protein, partial [Clavulina sp. PMI_390]
RTFTVKNNCSFTVWPAISVGSAKPSSPTGWQANAGTSTSFSVPDNWTAGRIWGRQGCDFSTSSSASSCLTGGCAGGLLCDATSGTAVGPTTIAEFTLGSSGIDYVDVSIVDGFNIPIKITDSNGCTGASCATNLNTNCPSKLQGVKDSTGAVIACNSDCAVDTNPTNSASCCTGSHNTPATCPASGVPDYSFFKGNCPNSIVYAYDESSTALWVCSSQPSTYTIT